jgi:hypothetical protein
MLDMPKDLFRKSVVTISNDENNNIMSQNLIGYVAKDTEEVIVVFSEFNGNLRFDIPKSIISVAGNSVIIDSRESLSKYKVKREDPLPQGKSLRLSAEEISGTVARVIEPEGLKVKIDHQPPDRLYKTAVQATILPTIETSDTQVGKSAEKSFKPSTQLRIDSTGETVMEAVKTQEIKNKEAQPSNYQTAVPNVNNLDMTESIHEKEEDTTSETKKVSSTSTTPTVLEENVIETEKNTKAQSELLSQDKAISIVPAQSLPTTQPEQEEKEVITLPRVDQQAGNEPVEKPGLDRKEEQPQELHVADTGISKEALDISIEKFDIPYSGDYLYPFSLSMALWQDFALASVNMYNGFAREFSKINESWFDIFWNALSESSEGGKKRENE